MSATAAIRSFRETADQEPWEYLDELRRQGEVVWDDDMRAWLVTSYELVKEIGRGDHEQWQGPFIPDPERPPLGMNRDDFVRFKGNGSDRLLILTEGAPHDIQHRWWMSAFSPKVMARWRETLVRPVTSSQIDRFVSVGRAELCSAFADVVGPRVIASIMGLPHDDEWLARIAELQEVRMELKQLQADSSANPALVARVMAATDELHEMVVPFILARESGEGDDFISMVWRDAEAMFGEGWTTEDVIATAIEGWEGAAGTTVVTTSSALYLLLTRDGLQDAIRAGGERALAAFVEETLRLFPPVTFRPRIAKQDVELGGVQIKKGELALAISMAGNRDPARYERPHEVDLERRAPRDHFGFFVGPRTCAGQGMARGELAEMVSVVLDRLQNLRLDPEAEPPRYREFLMRGWRPLNALFDPQ